MNWWIYSSQRKDNLSRASTPEEGLKPKVTKGKFVGNWWANRWMEVLENLFDPRKLKQGRTYARKTKVLSLEEKGSLISAKVQGERYYPHQVTIRLKNFSEQTWEKILNKMAGQALFEAQMRNGNLPKEIEEFLQEQGYSLFPKNSGEISIKCDCGDSSIPCKHSAAVLYLLMEKLDEDPFLLFRMRGRSKEQIFKGLQRRYGKRGGGDGKREDSFQKRRYGKSTVGSSSSNFDIFKQLGIDREESLPEELDSFWDIGKLPEEWSISIRPPKINAPVLRRLGPPPFLPTPLYDQFHAVFNEVGLAALEAAFSENGGEE